MVAVGKILVRRRRRATSCIVATLRAKHYACSPQRNTSAPFAVKNRHDRSLSREPVTVSCIRDGFNGENQCGGAAYQNWTLDAQGNPDSLLRAASGLRPPCRSTASDQNGSTQTRTANQQNELTSVSGLLTPTYDANGNMISDQNGDTLIYDAWNRLVEVKNSAGQVIAQYTYDARGYLVSESYPVGGTGVPAGQINYPGAAAQPQFISAGFRGDENGRGVSHFVDPLNIYYDSQWQAIETRTNGTANSNVTLQMVWSAAYPGAAAHTRESGTGFRAIDTANNLGSTPNALNINAPVLQDTYSGGVLQTGSRLYFVEDANWNPGAAAHTREGGTGFRAVEAEFANELSRSADALNTTAVIGYNATSGTWGVVQRYVYSPYGNLIVLNPDFTVAASGTAPMVNSLYQGMSQDPVTRLYYERARWYSPSLGTWISQDPAGYINGADTYQFVGSGPVGNTDGSGTASVPGTAPTGIPITLPNGLGTVYVNPSGGYGNHGGSAGGNVTWEFPLPPILGNGYNLYGTFGGGLVCPFPHGRGRVTGIGGGIVIRF